MTDSIFSQSDNTAETLKESSSKSSDDVSLNNISADVETPILIGNKSKERKISKLALIWSCIKTKITRFSLFFLFLFIVLCLGGGYVIVQQRMRRIQEFIALQPSLAPSSVPTLGPSALPTLVPSLVPSSYPTLDPTMFPSDGPSLHPSLPPTVSPSEMPSFKPSGAPTTKPSYNPSTNPSLLPTKTASSNPSVLPTFTPSLTLSSLPSTKSSTKPSSSPTPNYFDFYVFGDIPYNKREHEKMMYYVTKIPEDANFVVHVGDINKAARDGCPETSYIASNDILKTCPVPLFITPGDNEWNDCPDPDLAWDYFTHYFDKFDQNWDHNLPVLYQQNRTENFSMFMNDFGILFIGLNIVGGIVHDKEEWETRLSSQLQWTKDLIEQNKSSLEYIVIFGHGHPNTKHNTFFRGFHIYIRSEKIVLPILYIHGDGHS